MCTAAVSSMLKGMGAQDVECELENGKPTGKVTCKVPESMDLEKLCGAVKGKYSAEVVQ